MQFFIALIIASLTVAILDKFAKEKTTNQLMLLGVEITIIGLAFMLLSEISGPTGSAPYFFVGLTLIVVGLTVNIFGFRKN